MNLLEKAWAQGRRQLSEHEAKEFLKGFGIPVTKEVLATDEDSLISASKEIGFPLVLKVDSPYIGHKSELGLVITDIRDQEELISAYKDMITRHTLRDGEMLLVQEMVKGKRELVMGLIVDPQFGPCVMFGLGGIFTEILEDVSFRVAPLTKADANEMLEEIRGRNILGRVRGMPEANREALVEILIKLGEIGLKHPKIKEIDLNPVILRGSEPVVVDALIVLEQGQ